MKDIEVENDLKLQTKLYVLGFFVIALLGTFLHFIYEISNYNILIAPFSAVNQSIGEHIKIAVIPMIFWTFIEFITLKFRRGNLWCSLLLKLITSIIFIILLSFIYKLIFHNHNILVSITIFYFAIFLAQILSYIKITSNNVSQKNEEIAKYIVIIIFILFVIFTFIPPKISLFKDEVTSTYGVFKFEY